jgi:hypothetical protein
MMPSNTHLLTAQQSPDLSDWLEPTPYQEPENPLYRGNPLIEALPQLWSVQEVINLLKAYPDIDPTHRTFSEEVRLDMIENVAQVFMPLNEHITLQRRFSRAIRGGYVGRNLFDIPTVKKTEDRLKAEPASPKKKGRALARGFYIIGMSGMGKTTSTEAILDLYPQIIWHREYKGQPMMRVQLPWLKLDCPHDGSTRSLCFTFFALLDQLLGTNYYAAYAKNGQATVAKMQIYIAFLCELLNIGLLVIDEIQHLNQAKSGGAKAMLNFFVSLSNAIRIPVVLIGTYHAFDIFTGEFRQMRRGTRQGNFIWKRMKQDDPSWAALLKGIWPYQYVRQPAELTAELNEALYYVTQGITDLLITVFILAQERAIISGIETLTADIIYSVAADSMEIAYQPLEDMRQNAVSLQAYDDVLPPLEWQNAYVHQPQASSQGQSPVQITDPTPHVVFSDQDLRQNLREDDAVGTYQALKASDNIAHALDYVPSFKEAPC